MLNQYSIGPFKEILLLGGGPMLIELSKIAVKLNFGVKVLTCSRQALELIDNENLENHLKKNSIKYFVSDKITTSEVADFIGNTKETFCLSLGAAWIFTNEMIQKTFNGYLFNCHGTRLPQNRGAGGFSWQIMNGNRFGFSLIHLIDGGIDTGEILEIDEFLYPAYCRIPLDFQKVYREKLVVFLSNFLSQVRENKKTVKLISQPEYLSSYWPRLNTDINGWIDWNQDYLHLERFICAFDDPYSGAKTMLNGIEVNIKKVQNNTQEGLFHPFQFGLVYRKNKNWICVGGKNGGLVFEQIEDKSGKSLLESIQLGDRFYTPIEKLENAKSRVIYTPKGLKV